MLSLITSLLNWWFSLRQKVLKIPINSGHKYALSRANLLNVKCFLCTKSLVLGCLFFFGLAAHQTELNASPWEAVIKCRVPCFRSGYLFPPTSCFPTHVSRYLFNPLTPLLTRNGFRHTHPNGRISSPAVCLRLKAHITLATSSSSCSNKHPD